MEHVLALQCSDCGRRYDLGERLHRCSHHENGSGALDVVYDFDRLAADLELPGGPADSAWRYRDFLPLDRAPDPVSLGEGGTALVDADRLGSALDVDLSLKLECANPSGSTKDRASSVLATVARSSDHRGVVCASTGNAAASIATYAARAGLECLVFVPDSTPEAKATQPLLTGAKVVAVEGSYSDARSLADSVAARDTWMDRSSGETPYVRAGNRTLGYELAEQAPEADWVFVPVGNGGTLAGVWEGLSQFERCGLLESPPRLLGVQAAGTDPVVAAYEGTGEERDAGTCADSIDVPHPSDADAVLTALDESDGAAVSVTDDAILAAQRRLGDAEGIFAEPASAATLAGLETARESGVVDRGDSVVLVVTGTGLKDTKTATRVAPDRIRVPSDVDPTALAERLDAEP